jgi:hypothetical protein
MFLSCPAKNAAAKKTRPLLILLYEGIWAFNFFYLCPCTWHKSNIFFDSRRIKKNKRMTTIIEEVRPFSAICDRNSAGDYSGRSTFHSAPFEFMRPNNRPVGNTGPHSNPPPPTHLIQQLRPVSCVSSVELSRSVSLRKRQ